MPRVFLAVAAAVRCRSTAGRDTNQPFDPARATSGVMMARWQALGSMRPPPTGIRLSDRIGAV
jgi:hypothetical protein